MLERLQKILARAGVASRRAAEQLITAGRVKVNGKVVSELGAQAHPYDDKVEVDGKPVLAEKLAYVVLHKPREVVSTLSDPEGRPTVSDFLKDAGGRLYPVGRLDFATSGVLLATNDGDFANGLLHPRKAVPKTYVVKVRGRMEDEDLDRWRKGVELEDGKTLPAHVRCMRYEEERTWLEVTIHEGRNQQIRRMGDATGFFVMRLARISFAGITSDDLRPGQWRYITRDELVALREAFGVPKRVRQFEQPLKPTDISSRARGRVVQRGEEASPRQAATAERHARAAAAVMAERAERAPRVRGGPAAASRGTGRRPPARDDAPRHDAPRDARPARAPRIAPTENRPARAPRSVPRDDHATVGSAPRRAPSAGGRRPARETPAPDASRRGAGRAVSREGDKPGPGSQDSRNRGASTEGRGRAPHPPRTKGKRRT